MHDLTAAFDQHRPTLLAHCYRMLGSPVDAEDALQETWIRAQRGLEGFQGRASLRSWLHRIATNVCLDQLQRTQRRRELPMAAPAGSPQDPVSFTEADRWIEPIGEERLLPADATPDQILATRQSLRLTFLATLQRLPPRQRAALLMTQVAGLSAREAAEALDMSTAALNSALQRARSTLADTRGDPLDRAQDHEAQTVDRYVAAFEAWDLDALTETLHHDIRFYMPPIPLWLDSVDKVRDFLLGTGAGCEGSRMIPVRANGQPAFAQYKADGSAWGLVLLEVYQDRIVSIGTFLDVQSLFPRFGLPLSLPA